jgi:hypothetical protein
MNNIKPVNILAIGRNKEILDKVVELITKNTTYKALGALTDDEAIIQFRAGQFDIILLCGGIEPESDKKLRTHFLKSNPKIKIIQHFGGGSGLFYNEIQSALKI